MKRVPLTVLIVAVACALLEAIYLVRARQSNLELEARLAALRQQHERTARELLAAQKEIRETDATLAQADTVLKELSAISAGRDSKMESEVHGWLDRVRRLKDAVKQMPERTIPEMRFLEDRDWLAAAQANVTTDEEVRQALSSLRSTAKGRFAPSLRMALRDYENANNGQPPTEIMQLAPYFNPPIEPEILQRYTVPPPVAGQPEWARKVIVETSRVDDDYDSKMTIQQGGGTGFQGTSALQDAVIQAAKAYAKATGEKSPADPMALVPYLPAAMAEKFKQQIEESKKRGFK